MNFKQIKPKIKNRSDKYSWQLYKFISTFRVKNLEDIHVFYNQTQDDYSSESGSFKINVPFDNNKSLDTQYVMIGSKSDEECEIECSKGVITWFYGNKLSCIIGCSHNKYTHFANPWWSKDNVIDITEWFWKEYIKSGRCIWDREHNGWLKDDNNRFTYVGNTRRCNWCGKWQHKKIKKSVIIKREEAWVNE